MMCVTRQETGNKTQRLLKELMPLSMDDLLNESTDCFDESHSVVMNESTLIITLIIHL